MFIVDFDDTLFDTQGFKQARLAALASLGIPKEDALKSYVEARTTSDGLFAYSDARHAEMLERYGHKKEEVFTALTKVTESVKTFLFPGAVAFLEALASYTQPLILLSLGDPAFQEIKVKGCGIDHYFERLFMVDQKKEAVLQELFLHHKPEEVWFLNDKVQETKELHALYPEMRIVLKVSPNIPREEYAASGFSYFETLEEVTTHIQSYV